MAYSTNFRQAVPANNGFHYGGSAAPPPLPPRNYNTASNSYGGYGMTGYTQPQYGFSNGGYSNYGGYSGYGSYGTGGYGGFGSYGSFGGGYGYGGIGNNTQNRFIQIAENSARPAFDSFRSVMGMLQSVTMMFDSTFHAVHASYASVLGVADNFSRLRSMFAKVFSAFSLVKALQWLYRRLLQLVGMQREDPSLGAAWAAALNENLPAGSTTAQPSTWPAVALMALIIAGPFLIMKLVSQMMPDDHSGIPEEWDPMASQGTRAEVLYQFQAGAPQELSIQRNQALMVAPKQYQPPTPGWVLCCDSKKAIGLVPANYIRIESEANLKTVIPRSQPDTSVTPPSAATPLVPTLSNILPPAALDTSNQTQQDNSQSIGNENTLETDANSCPAPALSTSTHTDVTPCHLP